MSSNYLSVEIKLSGRFKGPLFPQPPNSVIVKTKVNKMMHLFKENTDILIL